MSTRRVAFYLSLAFLLILVVGVPIGSQYVETEAAGTQSILAGRNVNMVSGSTLPGGDPWLQRQNEPSIAVSSRNPLHLLAGANDYRTVDVPFSEGELPGKVPTAMVGDAWLGVFTSYDGGESWKSTMLPGFPQDPGANPLKGYRTAADPVVRSGPNGLFYYSGIAFNRDTNIGVVFVARFIDNNNAEGGDTIQYIDTKIIAKGTATKFLDKPWIAVDMPRVPFTNITIAGQTFPRHNVYIAYSAFSGEAATLGDIMFARSTNCGTSWGTPIKISAGKFAHQGATIAIKPVLGEVLVAWRRFAQTGKSPDQIYVAQSFSRGLNFQSPIKVADIPPFDQPTTDETQSLPGTLPGPAFRTNSYPTMTVDKSGHVYLAWSQRGLGAGGGARIMLSSSYLGFNWTSPQPIDPGGPSFLGHQIMPSLSFVAGKLIIVWYDQRNDVSGGQYGFNNWILDDQPYRHTMDVWAAEADTSAYPNLAWNFVQVSRYLYSVLRDESGDIIYDGSGNPIIFPVQFNCVNYPLFKGGHNPFVGDYIDVAASPQFVMDNWRNWIFNTESTNSPVFHVAWTDNRDVRPPLPPSYDWTNYVPPTSEQLAEYLSPEHPSCSGGQGNAPGMRNQNIYTSRITWGIEAGSPTNDKPLDLDVGRAFVVFVKNNTGYLTSFRLTIADQPTGGQASFLQFELLTTLDVNIAPYSTISRPVFISSSDVNASVNINIDEIDASGNIIAGGLKSFVSINADPSNPNVPIGEETHNPNIVNQANPNIVNWYVNPNIVNPNIVNPNIVNPNIVNPNIVNPNIVNPNIVNPNIVNPNIVNPNIVNPNIVNHDVPNPNIVNPNIVNPNIVNPNIVNAALEDVSITDVEWTVRNDGNVTTSFTLKTLSKKSPPEGVYAQLLVYRVHLTPAVAGAELSSSEDISACELKQEPHHELILNVVNPNIRNPNIVNPNIVNPNIRNASIENATFSVAPGEEVIVDLRVLDTGVASSGSTGFKTLSSESSTQAFTAQEFIESLGFAVTSQEVNSVDAALGIQIPPVAATTLVIGTSSLPDGVVNTGYIATLQAYGGDGTYYWYLNSGELPLGLTIGAGGVISGTPTTAGTYYFIVRVDDGSGQFDTQQYSIYIDSDTYADPLTILTTSLPSGVQGFWYGATLEAAGGVWPRTWSLASGSLPDGLSLDSGGVISGTPTASGSFSFTVRVTDKIGGFDTQLLSILIGAHTATYYTISGMIYDSGGLSLDGVVLRGLPNTPTTDTYGNYQDKVPAGWSGTVEPFKAGYSFSPSIRTYSALGSNQASQDYNAGPIVGPASKLVFTQSPSGGIGGAIWTTQPIVEVQDDEGNTITSDDLTIVSLAIDNNPGNGSLSGSISMTVTDGVATFAGLSIDKGGWGYTLEATSSPLTAATSKTFNIEGFSDTVNALENVLKWQTATPTVSGGVDKILIAGGLSADATEPLSDISFYNPSTNKFEYPENGMNQARQMHTATPLLDGTVLFVGGDDGGQTAEIFDPATGNFTSVSGTIYPHAGHRATLLQDGRVLVTGNMGANADSAEIYDPQTGTFEDAGPMNHARNRHTSTLLPSGKVLITGGYDTAGALHTAELYDPITGEFIEITDGMGSRMDHQATLLDDGTVLITGGSNGEGPNITAEIYDPTPTDTYPNGHFQLIGGMLYGHERHQAALLRDGTVLIIGGNSSGASNEIYDPLASEFRPTGPMSTYRFDGASAVLTDGRVLITGGYTEEGSYGPGDVWNPLVPFPTHIISGTISANGTGADVGGIILVGLPGHPLTNHGGYYEGLVLDGWSGTVTPTKPGYTFSLPSITYTDVTSDLPEQDYSTTGVPNYTISGTVTVGTPSGAPLPSVVMVGLPGDPVTDDAGNYMATVDYGWSGTVTPTLDHYHFIPPSQAYIDVASNQTADYTAVLTQYQLNVSKAGSGAGTVTSTDGGINCGSTCQKNYDYGTSVILTAAPAGGSLFAGWSGDVPDGHGSDNPLAITVDGNKSLTATFDLAPVLVLDHFDIGPSPISTQIIDTPFPITITAKDSGENVVTTYSGTNTLSVNFYPYTNISPANVTLTNGVWQGNVTITAAQYGVVINTSGGGKSGQCSAFDVLYPGPYSTISGQITYNGSPFLTGANVDFSLFDYGASHRYPVPPSSYNPLDGTFSIPNVRSGTYDIYLRTDSDNPPNYLPYPGDYAGGSGQFVVSAPTPVTQNVAVYKIIHLTAPVDNNPPPAPGIPVPPPYPGYSAPVTFQWEAIPEATTYEIYVWLCQDDPYLILNDNYYHESGITGIQKNLILPISDPNQHYEFLLIAYNASAIVVGELNIVLTESGGGIHGFRGSYQFKVTAGATYTISGTVTVGGSPLEGVVMDDLPGPPSTGPDGEYSATVDHGWSGTVTPTLEGYTFTPPSITYTNVTSNQAQDYEASSAPSFPEINIEQTMPSGGDIPDGGSFDFGSAAVGSNTYALFTIQNTGTGELTITTPITIGGTDSDQFHVETQPSSSVPPDGSTTLELRFSPTSEGVKSASIAIANNDADENPYDIALTGTAGYVAPFTRITTGPIAEDPAGSFGCAWGDYDGDGDNDLFISNYGTLSNFMYTNNGDGSFSKITSGAIVTDVENSYGCAWGDYDGDGDPDLFVANHGQNNSLYANNGDGTFIKITSGILVMDGGNSHGCAWGDYDNDGDLDLFVANGDGQNNSLYSNRGNGTFTKIASGAVVTDGGNSNGCAWGDYDNDGDLDLYVTNDDDALIGDIRNFLYTNNGDGTFTKVTEGAVVMDAGISIGCAWGDYDNDGDLDLFVVGTFGIEIGYHNRLYKNNGDGTFTRITEGPFVVDMGISSDCAWGDYDNDGDLDLFVANAQISDYLYMNNGDGTFAKVTDGAVVTDEGSARGCAWGDYDNDGDLDLVVTNYSQNNFMYENNGNSNAWLNVKCIGSASNISAIGAKVKVLATINDSPVWQLREVSGGTLSQDSLNAEFGLGNATIVDEIRIEWPSGIVQTLTNVSVNQFLTVTETETYEFVTKWGGYGTGDGQFDNPLEVAVDNSSDIYVADDYNQRIQKFTASGGFITKWGSWGDGDGEFYYPVSVGVDTSGGVVYVADAGNDRIQKFNTDGTFLGWWGRDDLNYTGWHGPDTGRTGTSGDGDGQFNLPEGIAVDSSGNVYVVDYSNFRIQKFTPTGTFLTKWGSQGSGDGQFDSPEGIAVDRLGNVYVVDVGNHRIQKFTSTGTFLGWWGRDNQDVTGWHNPGSGRTGTSGSGDGQLYNPFRIAVDSDTCVYVVDGSNQRIQKFTAIGSFLAKWGSFGHADGEFDMPSGVAVDNSGYVYVADRYNSRIQKFRRQ